MSGGQLSQVRFIWKRQLSGGSCCAAKWDLSLGNYAKGDDPRTLKFNKNYHYKKYMSFHFVVNKSY